MGAAVVLILVGAITKSALVPFHFWLPGAMAAPTPVSAYLHAAAMVKAGIYLVARLAPGFAETAFWLPVVLGLGLATMLVGGYRALRQTDIKLILAYGTVSQLGFLTMVVGLGTPDAALAGLAMLLAHGLFKATLFLVVGIIDHQSGTRDIRKLSGVFRSSRALGVVAAIGAASMAGVPPLAGFVAKESVLEAFVHHAPIPAAGPVGHGGPGRAGPGLHPHLRLQRPLHVGRLCRQARRGAHPVQGHQAVLPCRARHPQPAHHRLRAVAGPGGRAGSSRTRRCSCPTASDAGAADGRAPCAVARLHAGAGPDRPHVRPGPGHVLRPQRGGPAPGAGPGWIDGDRAYQLTIGALDDVAVWITGRTQRGSLYFYLAVILTVAFVLPLTAMLLAGKPLPDGPLLHRPRTPRCSSWWVPAS